MGEIHFPKPCQPLMRALEYELLGGLPMRDNPMESWAKEVLLELEETCQDHPLNPELVLAVSASAFCDIMYSPNWVFLLNDAVRRPRYFARTLLLLLQCRFPSQTTHLKGTGTLH